MERHVVAERQGAKGERKKVRRIEEEDGGSLERMREKEGPLTESGVFGGEWWNEVRQGEGGGFKERVDGLEGRGERILRMKEGRSEEREGIYENDEKKEKRGLGIW